MSVHGATLSSMDLSKMQFAIAAQNIANANDADYARVKINVSPAVMNNLPQGVSIDGLSTHIDENLQSKLYNKISVDSYNQTVSSYMQKANQLFGAPGTDLGIDAKLNDLLTTLDNFSRSPSSSTLSLLTTQSFESLADTISQTATSLQQLRMQVDSTLSNSLRNINELLSSTFNMIGTVSSLKPGTLDRLTAEGMLRSNYEEIASYFDIAIYENQNGVPQIFTTAGDALINEIVTYFEYQPLSTLSEYIYNTPFDGIKASAIDSAGNDMNLNRYIVGGGTSNQIPPKYSTGTIGGLLHLRDVEFPKILAQLDNYASVLKDQFNKVHNSYSGFPPASILTGTNAVTRDQVFGFTGNVRIAVVDNSGAPIPNLPDFNLNLSALDSGNGAGLANLQSIINEVNYHFGQNVCVDKHISLGNLSDIKLKSCTSNISTGIALALEMDNFSQNNSTVQILSATAVDGSNNNILQSYGGSTTTVPYGTTQSSDPTQCGVNLNLSSPPDVPLTITLQVSVFDGHTTSVSSLVYDITNFSADPFNGNINQRFAVSSKVNAADPGVISAPSFSSPIISATIVDFDGSVVPTNSVAKGLLRIQAASSGYNIAIDSLDSTQRGNTLAGITATNEAFSDYFGLNDLFVRSDNPSNWGSKSGTAVNLAIRSDIADNPSLFSRAKLEQVQDYSGQHFNIYQYQVGVGDNSGIIDFLSFADTSVVFGSAGSLAATQVTLAEYISNIIAFNAAETSKSISQADQSALLKNSIYDQLRNMKGVDINEELSNMIVYQQSFAASAKALKIGNELYDILFEVL